MSTELTVQAGNQADPLAVIDRANLADSTKIKYRRVLSNYLADGHSLTDADALARYADTLSKSGRAFLKASVRLLTSELATAVKSQATPDNVDQITATLYRIDALQNAVKVSKSKGTKTHTWLSPKEVRELRNACENGIVGLRDRVVVGLCVSAGLRRDEVVNLLFDDVQLVPVRDRMRTVLNVQGKGAKNRSVPISDEFANVLDEWSKVVGGEGYIARSLGMNREPGESLSAVGVFGIVRKRGRMMGKPNLAPHDLRRTFAQLGYDAGIPLTQLSVLLGHESIDTTRRYLNLDLDLDVTASDFVPF